MVSSSLSITRVGDEEFSSFVFSDTNQFVFGRLGIKLISQQNRQSTLRMTLDISRSNKYNVTDAYNYHGTIGFAGSVQDNYSTGWVILNNNVYANAYSKTITVNHLENGYLPKLNISFIYDDSNRNWTYVEVTVGVPLQTMSYSISEVRGYYKSVQSSGSTVYSIYFNSALSMRISPSDSKPNITFKSGDNTFDLTSDSSLSGTTLSVNFIASSLLGAFSDNFTSLSGTLTLKRFDPYDSSIVLASVTLFITVDLNPATMSPIVAASSVNLQYIGMDDTVITSRQAITGADRVKITCTFTLCSDVSAVSSAGIIANNIFSAGSATRSSSSLRQYSFSCITSSPILVSGSYDVYIAVTDKRGFKVEYPVSVKFLEYEFPTGIISARRSDEYGQAAMESTYATLEYSYSVYVVPESEIPVSKHNFSIRYRLRNSDESSSIYLVNTTVDHSSQSVKPLINQSTRLLSYKGSFLLSNLDGKKEYLIEMIIEDTVTGVSGRVLKQYILGTDQTVLDISSNGRSVSIGATAPGGADYAVEIGWPVNFLAGIKPVEISNTDYALGLNEILQSGIYSGYSSSSTLHGYPIQTNSAWTLIVLAAGDYPAADSQAAAQILIPSNSSFYGIRVRFVAQNLGILTDWRQII